MSLQKFRELSPLRFFSPDSVVRNLAVDLYQQVEHLPILSPHGHINPAIFCAGEENPISPVDALISSEDYLTRKLFSLGVSFEELGFTSRDGSAGEKDHRKIWQILCRNIRFLTGSTAGMYLDYELQNIFEINEALCDDSGERIYNLLAEKLTTPEYQPRALFKQFRIEVLCTTDQASDHLDYHRQISAARKGLRILPTFRADSIINLDDIHWREQIDQLGAVTGENITDYRSFIRAVESQRGYFRSMGAVAADCSTPTPYTCELPAREVERIFQRALKGQATPEDGLQFGGHMLMEMARMSLEDGLVLQLHPGSFRNYDLSVYNRFGADMGCDIPTRTEFTRNLQPLLNTYGKDPRLTLILFSLDEGTYTRELAPLAGFYPSIRLGPPWWYLNNPNGMARYFDQVMDIAGLEKMIGCIDDTSSLFLIPAKHDIWRRVTANWIAGLAARHIIGLEDARYMMDELAIGLSRTAYHL
jgi:glucuronate isomerase